MAITQNPLTSGAGAWGGSHTTASITPGANRLIFFAIASGSFDLAITHTLAGNGLTWVQVARKTQADTPVLTIFRAMGAAPTAGTIVITNSQNARSVWSVFEFDGVDTSGTDGSGAIVQSAVGSGASTTPSATLAAFGSADNGTVGAFSAASDSADITPGTGFSLIHNANEGSGNNAHIGTEWRNDNDTSVDCTQASAWNWCAVGVEIKAAAAAGTGGAHGAMYPRMQRHIHQSWTVPRIG